MQVVAPGCVCVFFFLHPIVLSKVTNEIRAKYKKKFHLQYYNIQVMRAFYSPIMNGVRTLLRIRL